MANHDRLVYAVAFKLSGQSPGRTLSESTNPSELKQWCMVKGKGRDGRNGPAPRCFLPPYLLRKALACWHEIANKDHSLKCHRTC